MVPRTRPPQGREAGRETAALPKGAKQTDYLGFIAPTLATARKSPPSGAHWLHEIKFDGYRLQAHIRPLGVKLLTRSGLDWTMKFGPAIALALADLHVQEAILDGEVVAEEAGRAPNFSALQDALATGRTDRLVLYAFDLLYLNGYDLRAVPLIGRKTVLEALIGAQGNVRYSEHFEENGQRLLQHVCRLGLEGVVSKLRDAPYRSGRVKDWIKSKCSERQEFVVAGYVPSTVSSKAIGSLVLGYYDNGKLIYAGRVGTGFSNKVAADLFSSWIPCGFPRARLRESSRLTNSGRLGLSARSWSPK